MKIIYISPSLIPSQTANSIHVINQVKAFQVLNYEITLFAARSLFRKNYLNSILSDRYGSSIKRLKTIFIPFKRFNEPLIAIYAIIFCLFNKSEYIISRNLYASVILSLIYDGTHIYEVHELFSGYQRLLQKIIFLNKKIKFITISNALSKKIIEENNISSEQIKVLHDAAPSNLEIIDNKSKKLLLSQYLLLDMDFLNSFKGICVYSGSLGKGRGVELIQEISMKLNNVLFLLVGGSKKEVEAKLKENKNKNIIFTGFKKYYLSLRIAACADILLMPYQKKVVLGNEKRNVSMTMSPLKMFEYMGLEVPIISSDLPVLREILKNKYNSILVRSDSKESWAREIDNLLLDKNLSMKIAKNAKKQILKDHTWERRAKQIITF